MSSKKMRLCLRFKISEIKIALLFLLLAFLSASCQQNTLNDLLEEYGSQCIHQREIEVCSEIKERMEAYQPTESELLKLNKLCDSSSGWICSLSSYYHHKDGNMLKAVELSRKSCLLKFPQGCRLGLSIANLDEDKLFFANKGCMLDEPFLCSKEIELLISQKKWNAAETKAQVRCQNNSSIDCYNLACIQSIQNNLDGSLLALEKAIELGFKDYKLIANDPDLKLLRESKKADAVLAKIKTRK